MTFVSFLHDNFVPHIPKPSTSNDATDSGVVQLVPSGQEQLQGDKEKDTGSV